MTLSPIASGPVTFTLTHNRSYAGRRNPRPEIEVEIATKTASGLLIGALRTNLVVDSGADCTMLDSACAAPLGIDLSRCRVERIGGIEGGEVLARSARVLMHLCERWIDVEVCFHPGRRPQLLGRQDVFDNLLILFFHRTSHLYASTA